MAREQRYSVGSSLGIGWSETASRFVTAAVLVLVAPPLIYLGGKIGKGVCIIFVGVMAAELAMINSVATIMRHGTGKSKNAAGKNNRAIKGLADKLHYANGTNGANKDMDSGMDSGMGRGMNRGAGRSMDRGMLAVGLAVISQIAFIIAPALLVAIDISLFGISTTAPSFIVLTLAVALALTTYFVRHWSALVMAALLAVLLLTVVLLLNEHQGGLLMVLAIGTIAVVDTMGYLVGRLVGGIRLIPSISPGKTWSGAISGFLASPLPLAVYGWFMGGMESAVLFGGIGVVVGVSAIGGDLVESWFKRCHMIKDASQILPGHGGILDRLDGYLLAVPVFYGMLWLVQ
ncbi:MAG: phosphatidate cytidylyltransferase [Proteobacteria bacterium]|nr:phosphatidate cytidylyltransferase [Pseudomonadota bacterium]